MNAFSILGNAIKDAAGQTIGYIIPGSNQIGSFVKGVPTSVQNDATNWLGQHIPGVSTIMSVDSGINAVGDFFGKLSEGNLWLRIAEAALGIMLIAVALAKITGADNVVVSAVKTGAKVAAA